MEYSSRIPARLDPIPIPILFEKMRIPEYEPCIFLGIVCSIRLSTVPGKVRRRNEYNSQIGRKSFTPAMAMSRRRGIFTSMARTEMFLLCHRFIIKGAKNEEKNMTVVAAEKASPILLSSK